MIDVRQNFLPQEHFHAIEQLFMSDVLPWHFNDRVVSSARQFMFVHSFLNDGKVVDDRYMAPVQAMLGPLQAVRPFVGVGRIKANLYTNQGAAIAHPVHYDLPPGAPEADKFFVAVYHVNSCNGCTIVGTEEFRSEANQLIVFDNVAHNGTVQTDTDSRVVINFNLRAPD